MINEGIYKAYCFTKSIPAKIKSAVEYKKNTEKQIVELEERLQWFIDHSDIKALKPATGYLRDKQLKLENFANEFFEEVKELDLQPFLIGGNLIGAYRHGGYIPWDDDLDFGLLRNDYEKLIEYCKENYFVTVYDGKWSEYNSDKHIARLDKVVKEHPNEYILDIWVDQIQITRGTSCIDRMAIDFWAYDFYADDYSIEEYVDYLRYLDKKKREVNYVDKIISFLKEERLKNNNISIEETTKIFPGIDNVGGYLRVDRISDWIYTKDVLPLKKVRFESSEYLVPLKMEKWMEFEYPDYMSYPNDVGMTPHEGYKEKYILKNMPCVEFYLVDSFEIYHFLPIYQYFEKNGIYACFIAEKPNQPNAWFDYEIAIKILEVNGVRYKTKPNYDVEYVFTTQDEYLVDNYKNKKVHMCYGVGLTSYSFCESERSIDKFDLKLVHGDVSFDIVKSKAPSLPMIRVGYLKYSEWGNRKDIYDVSERKQEIIKKNSSDKPILLYFPTWDSASSIDAYAEAFRKLRKDYFIITKAHHCTFRLDSESEHRRVLNEISDVILEGNYSFEEAVKLSNLVICDAISGAATEVPYLNRNAKLILLYSPIKEKNQFKDFIEEYAIHVKNADDLLNAVVEIERGDKFMEKRQEIVGDLYSPNTSCLEELKEYILKNCRKGKDKCV